MTSSEPTKKPVTKARHDRLMATGRDRCLACGVPMRANTGDKREGYCCICWRTETAAGRRWMNSMNHKAAKRRAARKKAARKAESITS